MQHLDEGTIHAWLDGALPAEEGAAVERHAAACATCAAAVAEARGLLAASSRIVRALDGAAAVGPAPAPAVPAAAPPVRRAGRAWVARPRNRAIAAAAMALLAVGVLRVARVSTEQEVAVAAADTAAVLASAPAAAPPAAPQPTVAASAGASAATPAAGAAARVADPGSAPIAITPPPAPPPAAARAEVAAAQQATRDRRGLVAGKVAARAAAPAADVATAAAPPAPPGLGAAPAPPAPASRAAAGVTGRVTDPDGRPLGGAQVLAEGAGAGAVTDEQGRYEIAGLAPGRYVLRARRLGYAAQRAESVVVAPPDGAAAPDLVLAPAVNALESVVVTGSGTAQSAAATSDAAVARWAACYTVESDAPWTPGAGGRARLPARLTLERARASVLEGAPSRVATADPGTTAPRAGQWAIVGTALQVELPDDGSVLRLELTPIAETLRGTARFTRGGVTFTRPVTARVGCGR